MTLLELLQLMRKHLKLMTHLACRVRPCGRRGFVRHAAEHVYGVHEHVRAGEADCEQQRQRVNYSNLNASQMLANDVSTLLKSDRIASDTAKDLHLDSLKGYSTKVTSETTSRVITLEVTGADPNTAATISNEMASNVSKVAQEVMDVQSVNVIDEATAPTAPSGPNRPMYVAVAILAGLFIAIAIVVVSDMLNTKVRNADEIEELLGLPVIGRMPAVKGGK